ncbi:MAG: alkaline phosphatase family protein [Chloroflexota bacterium]|nr:alkaline phosphatase family protein [Chloroflexota bacterium]
MSDVDRLLGWFADGSLVRPDATEPGTVHLARALVSLAGAESHGLEAPAQGIADAIGAAEHYVLVLIDGLGMNLIDALPADSFLRRHVSMEMQAVFPSSTAPALTALFTACWPSVHAVTGWWTYLPDAGVTSTILPFIERFSGRPLGDFGVTSESAFRTPSTLPQLRGATSWMPEAIAESTSSRYFRGDTAAHGYKRLSDACEAIARSTAAAHNTTYTYLYIPYVDNTEHEHGPASEAVRRSLDDTQRELEELARTLAGRGRIIITADHGQIDIAQSGQRVIREDDPLLRLLIVPPTGDYRAPLFHVRAGQEDRFVSEFSGRFGDEWALLNTDEVDELRLLGPEPLASETRRRWGDFVAIGAGRDAIRYAPREPMLGYHGGLRPEEMRIPLILV